MSPAEDASLLLTIVRRHLRTLRLGLDPAYPQEALSTRQIFSPEKQPFICNDFGVCLKLPKAEQPATPQTPASTFASSSTLTTRPLSSKPLI